MDPIVKFDWMCRDEVYAHITVNKKTGEVTCEELQPVIWKQFFGKAHKDIPTMMHMMEMRLFDRNRPDAQDFLDYWGVKEYNPYELCRKTHGASLQDLFWIRWEGEDLTWDDVKFRND